MKNSLVIYYDYAEHFELLSDEELGRLIRAMLLYDKEGTLPQFDGMLKMAFSFIKTQLDIDKQKFEKICERNRRNIQKRWENSTTTGTTGIPSDTKNTDNDNDNDNDNGNDTNNNVCNNSAHENSICHLGSKFKTESCFYCMKKHLCKNKESPDFKIKHPDETFENWDRKKTESHNSMIEEMKESGQVVPEELLDYDWLNNQK